MKFYQNIFVSILFGLLGGIITVAANSYLNPTPHFYQFDMSKAVKIEIQHLLTTKGLSGKEITKEEKQYISNIYKHLSKFNKKGYVFVTGVFVGNNKVKDITNEILRQKN